MNELVAKDQEKQAALQALEDEYEGLFANEGSGKMAKGIWRKVSDADDMTPHRDFSRTGLVFFGTEDNWDHAKTEFLTLFNEGVMYYWDEGRAPVSRETLEAIDALQDIDAESYAGVDLSCEVKLRSDGTEIPMEAWVFTIESSSQAWAV